MASVYFNPAVGGDGTTVTDDTNPTTGLAAGGHRLRFVPALAQSVAIAGFVVNTATQVSNDAASALASKNAAAMSEANSLLYSGNSANSATAADAAKEQAQVANQQVQDNLNAALALTSSVSTKSYASYALADAGKGSLTANDVVFVAKDETRNNEGVYYTYNGSILVFLRYQGYYQSNISYIDSDSIQNMITKLLVLNNQIPQSSPSADIAF